MNEYSVLGKHLFVVREEERKNMPDFFLDLNLDGIIRRITDCRKDYSFREYFLYLPKQEDIEYRSEVLREMEEKSLLNPLLAFTDGMLHCRQTRANSEKAEGVKKDRWILDAIHSYCEAIELLARTLEAGEVKSEGLRTLFQNVEQYRSQKLYQTVYKAQKGLTEQFDSMRFQFSVIKDRLVVTRELGEGDYCKKLDDLFPNQQDKPYVESPFHDSLHLSSLEESILQLFAKEDKEAFTGLHTFATKAESCFSEEFFRLEQELQFYLAFLLYQQKMNGFGYELAYPYVGGQNVKMEVEDAYDLALAQKYSVSKQEVVANDVYYDEGEHFQVITGPNQGGKTTFARSIGQVVYFALLGLKAPCHKASMPKFSGILTHFSVEESLETGRGKLKEELIRLEPMIHQLSSHKFVIINELFTTAATYDAFIMGRRVMEHFMKHECLGIYVTHIQELTEGIDGVVSMVALLKPGEEHLRTFRIQRRVAEGVGYADAIVNRYHLTREALVQRVKELPKTSREATLRIANAREQARKEVRR